MKEKEVEMNGRIYPEGYIKSEHQKYLEKIKKEKSDENIRAFFIVIAMFLSFGLMCYLTDIMNMFYFIMIFLGVNVLIAIFGPPTGDGW